MGTFFLGHPVLYNCILQPNNVRCSKGKELLGIFCFIFSLDILFIAELSGNIKKHFYIMIIILEFLIS